MTLRLVAKRAGVAVDTVRKALRDAPGMRPPVKARVLAAARELDYHPNLVARALRQGSLRLVPLSMVSLTNPFFASLALDLTRRLTNMGLEPALCADIEHVARVERTLSTCGCILGYPHHSPLVNELARRQKVVIVHGDPVRVPHAATVVTNFKDVYCQTAQALVHDGRSRVAVCSEWLAIWGGKIRRAKTDAIFAALPAAGLRVVGPGDRNFFGDAHELGAWLTAHPGGLDAVVCENDQLAARLYGILASQGVRMPDDVRLVGCDANFMLPGTWSVRIDTDALAMAAVEQLQRLLGGAEPPPRMYYPDLVDETGALVKGRTRRQVETMTVELEKRRLAS